MRGKISAAVGTICAALSSAAYADVTISSAATQNMSCGGGICTPTASSAILNVTDLENLLASGNVKVTTTGSGVQANNIDVDTALAWSSTGTLALDANQSITIDSAVSITGLSGLSLTTNDGGTGGQLSFGRKGGVSFQNLASQLAINGAAYTLVGDISTLAKDIDANTSGNFALANNYDASKDGAYQYAPIYNGFQGIFEGLGNTISNFTVSEEDISGAGVGLFWDSDGVIRDLVLSQFNIEAQNARDAYVRTLAGFNEGEIDDVSVSGAVSGKFRAVVGGLVGSNIGTITNAISTAAVTVLGGIGTGAAGGLVGTNSGPIRNSYSTGLVQAGDGRGDRVTGGLVGQNLDAEISNSQATGDVEGEGDVGGLVGSDTDGTINESFATGTATSTNRSGAAGGLVGYIVTDGQNGTATINQSYSTGAATSSNAGGLIGIDEDGLVTTSYWDKTTSGTTEGTSGGNISGLTGLKSKQLRSGLPAGFDPAVWAEKRKINNGFPYLIADPPLK